MPHMDIVSGAGHDACYVSRVAPTAMIFVPCKDGISHNEIEDANKADIGAGAPDPPAGDGRESQFVKSGLVSTATAALVATVAGVGGTLPIVLAAAAAVGATPAQASSWVSGLGHRHGAHARSSSACAIACPSSPPGRRRARR